LARRGIDQNDKPCLKLNMPDESKSKTQDKVIFYGDQKDSVETGNLQVSIEDKSFVELAKIPNTFFRENQSNFLIRGHQYSYIKHRVLNNLVEAFTSLSQEYDENGFSEKGEIYAFVQNFTTGRWFDVQIKGKSVIFHIIADYFDSISYNQLSRWNEGSSTDRISFPKLNEIVSAINKWGEKIPNRTASEIKAARLKLVQDKLFKLGVEKDKFERQSQQLELRLKAVNDSITNENVELAKIKKL
jgi:hypothetical protein